MILVGLTGGIGSGKSYIAKIFQGLGVQVYNSDTRARIISDNNPDIRKKIIRLFGPEAYTRDKLDRPFIAGIVFDNPDKLEELNNIIHPGVQMDFETWVTKAGDQDYLVKEAAILFETDSYKKLDYNILVIAPDDIKIRRIIERDRVDENHVTIRMGNQWDDEKKMKYADFIINNDGKHLLLPQVLDIHNKILEIK